MKPKQKYQLVGDYRHYTTCRLCSLPTLLPVIDLGYVPLAGGFIRSQSEIKNEKFYPLELSFCTNCFLLQSVNVIDRDALFKDYFYHSSVIKTLTSHFMSFSQEVNSLLEDQPEAFIVEIGCNDGGFIKQSVRSGYPTLGVDPATNIVLPLIKEGLPIINDYFSEDLAHRIQNEQGNADVIISFNTMAHIEDMHDILRGIKLLLKKDGIFIFEVHYLGNLLKETQYDMIYHEHQYYYSFLTLKKFFSSYDMEIFNVKPTAIHAGSMRYYVQNKIEGKHTISSSVTKLQRKEISLKLNKVDTFLKFSERIEKTRNNLLKLLNTLKESNATIAGYGASGRGTVIMNYCNLNAEYLRYVIDDSSAKQRTFTPGTHLPIRSSVILKTNNRPDYVVLFAWSFFKEIKERNNSYLKKGGKFILPLPTIKVVES